MNLTMLKNNLSDDYPDRNRYKVPLKQKPGYKE